MKAHAAMDACVRASRNGVREAGMAMISGVFHSINAGSPASGPWA